MHPYLTGRSPSNLFWLMEEQCCHLLDPCVCTQRATLKNTQRSRWWLMTGNHMPIRTFGSHPRLYGSIAFHMFRTHLNHRRSLSLKGQRAPYYLFHLKATEMENKYASFLQVSDMKCGRTGRVMVEWYKPDSEKIPAGVARWQLGQLNLENIWAYDQDLHLFISACHTVYL